ncbi:MAG: hypothetical protein KA473_06635 [Anaerolineales bacterium]|nr:hypothetical protein [Anaerolineales bacterium]
MSRLDLETGDRKKILIGVVGPCGSGKSTLITGLERQGYRCRHIAQEHSYVQNMWQVLTAPDLLIFLQSSYLSSTTRRKLNWSIEDFEEQQRRLSHAYRHAHLIIETADLSVGEVLARALEFIKEATQ